MSRNLCLTRQCLGLVTRIECSIRPLAGDTGMWTLLFAAGMTGEQPSTIKSQGPFHGPFVAQTILDSIVESLTLHGYELADDPQIWCLHLQAHLRQLNGGRQTALSDIRPPRSSCRAPARLRRPPRRHRV
ncbi:hypothetical protein P0D92_10745 [Pseudomonas sp. CBSPAW29]|nr:hypothetical protein P0D92_10745 [Pseudomonas sp. CBSPAW29]